ncbi:MAG: hypothetical protein F2840_04825 [Actinobacteria bacterium]|uniref:Unannotated protein n=1 Tax=freshwater metagenome TaxID=449393 RepID=A0A6J7JF18_9ZZZZ|nr:hypothetical protein [Actinomycetota bacterium]
MLRAGPLSVAYSEGELRGIRLGSTEILRRIYLVFQDRNWTARPWVITAQDITDGTDRFTIALTGRGTFDAEPFTWGATITGEPDGTITYAMSGRASAPFIRNRLGLCVLHPIDGIGGRACTVEDVSGQVQQSSFPLEITPHQPFLNMRSLTHEVVPGVTASVRLTGETFESEDHRNWSDASFKTYCTPISRPFPVTVQTGDSIEQALTLRLSGQVIPPAPEQPRPATITLGAPSSRQPLPRIGFQIDTDGHAPSETEIEQLRALKPAHLRIDIDAASPGALDRLEDGLRQARAIGTCLVPAVFAADPADLARFRGHADASDIDHWLVFDPNAKVTPTELITAARASLGPRAVIGAGTNLYFTELNRGRPDPDEVDVLNFSINPQVHASDDETIVQNLRTQAAIAAGARDICGSTRICVGPVTLRPRFNPNATAPDLDFSNTPLPSSVDARQSSGLGAAWTAISIKYLAEPGAIDAITYYELTGWRGLLEREKPVQPADFRSVAGEPFPLMSVFAGLVGFTHVRPCESSDPARFDALLLESQEALRLMVANFTAEMILVEVTGPAAAAEPAGGSAAPGGRAEAGGSAAPGASAPFVIEAAPYAVTTHDYPTVRHDPTSDNNRRAPA